MVSLALFILMIVGFALSLWPEKKTRPVDEANPALCGKLSVDAHVNSQSAGWLISFSLGLKHGLMCFTRYRDRFSAARRRLLYLAGALYEPRNPTRGSHRPPEIVLLEARDF